ncbi:hypothetical protein H0H92_013379 [Tricholoma furcatifolium]|nr:hypothetical protein H0H92_013379 [Tricholoma furcatifolium]
MARAVHKTSPCKVGSSSRTSSPRKASSPRKTPHCSKCPGKPLRSQCSCTPSGRRYLQDKILTTPTASTTEASLEIEVTHNHFASSSSQDPRRADEPSNSDDEDSESSSEDLLHPQSSPQKTPERIRINRKNAIYNLVSGAMRGSQPLPIPRSKPLRPPIDNIARSTQRFNRVIKEIIIRSERISEETGCWLLVLAQSPSSKALTYYASPRLRREAKTETVQLIAQFQDILRTLLAAKRGEALLMQKQFEQKEWELQQANEANAASQAQLREKEMELASKEAELEYYRTRLTVDA